MPQWAKFSTYMECKKKGHLAFNCPPKYNCKIRKTQMKNNKPYNKNDSNTQKEESAVLVKEFAGMVISANMRNNTSQINSHQHKRNKNNMPKTKNCIDRGHISSACKSPEWDHKRSFHHHKMRIKLITNRDTINYFKEKFYYLLSKNGHYNSGIIQTIQQEVKKMNTMDLLSTLWIIGNLKTKSNKHNHKDRKSVV